MSDEKLVWVDIENFGLDVNDPILELGICITDLNLDMLATNSWLVWSDQHAKRLDAMIAKANIGNTGEEFVLKMHRGNGLFDDAAEHGKHPAAVEIEVSEWLIDNKATGQPMCGSSVHFDQKVIRTQMPGVMEQFHYRIIDNSTLKELCRRYNPSVFAQAPAAKYTAPIHHRVSLCLEDTIAEFRFYRDEFLLW